MRPRVAFLLWGAIGVIGADGFSSVPATCKSTRRHLSRSRLASNFFDDFEGFGDSGSNDSGSNSLSSLQSRMGQVRDAEAAYDAKQARNWRRGNYGVRGFALDKSSSSENPALVSVVAAPTPSSSGADISLPQDRALPEDQAVAVGRTDGSVFIVKLGYDYLTTFVEAPKLVVEEGEGNGEGEAEMSVRVEGEWMNSNELQKKMQGDEQQAQPDSGEQIPFEIICQFTASDQGDPIKHLVFHDGEGSESSTIICTSAGISSDIVMWTLPSSDDESPKSTPLTGAHSDAIISLRSMVLHNENGAEQNILFSASRDGTFALWNLDRNGELVSSWQCLDSANDSSVSLTCADVSNPTQDDSYGTSDETGSDVAFLGTSHGYVIGYDLQELLARDSSIAESLRFRAHGPDCGNGEAVTAIKVGGDGTIPASARLRGGDESQTNRRPGLSSSILLTGGEDGSVKQWEILTQRSGSSLRMEHWPRMSTQRMKRRAHLFSGHDGAVTSIAQQSNDGSKFLTCGQDGTVSAWSASSGEELFRMDGFSGISSLACLGRELLVTDGMEEYVCVHDFGIEEDAASNGYDLEM